MTRRQTPQLIKPPGPKLFYGYIIVGAAMCIQIIGWGLFNSFGVYFNQMLAEFNWPRETISGAYSLSQIGIGISAIFLGGLNDRLGPRLLMTCGGIMAGLGFAMMSQIHSIWQLYLFQGIIVGIGSSGTDVVLLSTVARWFVKRRGIMSGMVKAGTGIGTVVMPIISAWLITIYGWRITLIILGTVLFIVFITGAQLLRRDPARMKQFPDGDDKALPGAVPMSEAGLTFSQSFRTRQFWLLCGVYFVVFFIANTMIVHVAPFAADLKLSAQFAAAMVSIIGGVSIVGRLTMGQVSDKIKCRRTLLICFMLFGAALTWLQFVHTAWALVIFVVVYGFGHGGFYAIMSPVVAEYFGTRAHGTIFGIVICAASLGGAIGPMLTGYIFDNTASYQVAFMILLGLAAAGLAMTFFSAPPQKKPAGVDWSGRIKA